VGDELFRDAARLPYLSSLLDRYAITANEAVHRPCVCRLAANLFCASLHPTGSIAHGGADTPGTVV